MSDEFFCEVHIFEPEILLLVASGPSAARYLPVI